MGVSYTRALLLRPRRGADTSIEVRELREQTPQAHPTRPYLDTHHMERQDQPVQEGQTRHTFETFSHYRTHSYLLPKLIQVSSGWRKMVR